jgi:hypothetical protein
VWFAQHSGYNFTLRGYYERFCDLLSARFPRPFHAVLTARTWLDLSTASAGPDTSFRPIGSHYFKKNWRLCAATRAPLLLPKPVLRFRASIAQPVMVPLKSTEPVNIPRARYLFSLRFESGEKPSWITTTRATKLKPLKEIDSALAKFAFCHVCTGALEPLCNLPLSQIGVLAHLSQEQKDGVVSRRVK